VNDTIAVNIIKPNNAIIKSIPTEYFLSISDCFFIFSSLKSSSFLFVFFTLDVVPFVFLVLLAILVGLFSTLV